MSIKKGVFRRPAGCGPWATLKGEKMSTVQRLIGTRPDGVIRSNENTKPTPGTEGKIILPKWLLYWGQHIPNQEVDQIFLTDGAGIFYNRIREIGRRPLTPEVIEMYLLTPEEVEYFTTLAEQYAPEE